MSDSSKAVDEQQVIDEQKVAPRTQTSIEQAQAAKDFSRAGDKDQLTMRVRVNSPFRDYYDGTAFSLSAKSATGNFDILPHHHNFISLLLPCELIIRTLGEGERKILISGGIINVKADQVIVFLDI